MMVVGVAAQLRHHGKAALCGSHNVENVFARANALNTDSWVESAPVLAAYAELNTLLVSCN